MNVRRGVSLLEMTVSLASATILTIGLAAALATASRGLELRTGTDGQRVEAARLSRQVAQDLQQATRFVERGAAATSFFVPDRDGDGDPELIRYAWGGAGAPLTYSVNGESPMPLASAVKGVHLSYQAEVMTAPPAPEESSAAGVPMLYITGGSQVQASGISASQRAASGPMVLASPSPLDRKKIELFESWGYDVTFVLPQEPWSNLSSLLDQTQVVFISSEADAAHINAGIYGSSKGIVIERASEYDDANFAWGAASFSGTSLSVRRPTHYILTGYANGQSVPLFTQNTSMYYFSTLGSGVANLMGPSWANEPGLLTMSRGDRMRNLATSPGRRVLLPWGFPGFNYDRLTVDGRNILRRCLEWGAGAGSDPNSPVQTFGHTYVYMSLLDFGPSKSVATKVRLTERGKIKSISAFVGGPAGIIRYAIYSHHPSNRPDSLRAQSSFALTSNGIGRWVTLNVNDTMLEPGEYWLAITCGLAAQTLNMAPGGDFVSLNYDATLLGFRNSWGSPESQEAVSFSIYATYEPE